VWNLPLGCISYKTNVMTTNLNLSIPKPCAQDWSNFIPQETGGFCASCSKTVIDFTKMSDDEIVKFFVDKPSHTCGRFRPDQLKNYAVAGIGSINPGLTLFKAGFLSLLFLLTSKQTSAQTSTASTKIEVVETMLSQTVSRDTTITSTVKGVVKSAEDNSPLPGVNVVLKGTPIGTVTDSNGEFKFPDKLKVGDVLVFTFIGLESQEYKITKDNVSNLKIPMVMCQYVTLGEVAVNTLYSNQSGLSKWWSKVKNIF
jgi:hypothetical protein